MNCQIVRQQWCFVHRVKGREGLLKHLSVVLHTVPCSVSRMKKKGALAKTSPQALSGGSVLFIKNESSLVPQGLEVLQEMIGQIGVTVTVRVFEEVDGG